MSQPPNKPAKNMTREPESLPSAATLLTRMERVAVFSLAHESAYRHRHRHILGCLRRAVTGFRAPGARRTLADLSSSDRGPHLRQLRRAVVRCLVVQLRGREIRSRSGCHGRGQHHVRDELGLCVRREFLGTVGVEILPGHRYWRTHARGGCLYQRTIPGQGKRPVFSVVRDDLSNRAHGHRTDWRYRRAGFGLEGHVSRRSHSWIDCCCVRFPLARVAAMVDRARPIERGGDDHRTDRGKYRGQG